jgi:hypothetical protein
LTAERYVLVIIDTFTAAFPKEQTARDVVRADYRQSDSLTRVARAHDLAILTISHTRKAGPRDEPDMSLAAVSGTGGRTAPLDAVLVLRKNGDRFGGATLTVTSRDTEGLELKLARDPLTGAWVGAAPRPIAVKARAGEAEVRAVLERLGPSTASAIQQALAPTHR